MDVENAYRSDSEQAAKCSNSTELAAYYPLVQPQFENDHFFCETGQEFQSGPNGYFSFSGQESERSILSEEQPAFKRIRRSWQDSTNGTDRSEISIPFLPDHKKDKVVEQCVCFTPQSPDCACADRPLTPPYAVVAVHEQFFWSQESALPLVNRSHRRHAICDELDTTVLLLRNRIEGGFNLRCISDELNILTGNRKRKLDLN